MKHNPLPYFDERDEKIDTLVFHCLAFDVDAGLQSFKDASVSSHYMIGLDGKIHHLVDEKKRAWHAGKSFWRGRESLNKNSIGIELCSLSFGQEEYDPRQIHALIRLSKKLIRKYKIKPQNMIGHSDIAPVRKADPGKAFPWRYLSKHGIGLWYNMADSAKVSENDPKTLLERIGYDVSNLDAAKWAFCRHFLPDQIGEDKNVRDLIENPYPQQLRINEEAFLTALKAVYFKFTHS